MTEIRRLEIKDVDKVCEILNTSLSFGLANDYDLLKNLNSPYNLCLVEKGEVVGYISGELITDINQTFLYHSDILERAMPAFEKDKSILISRIVVDEGMRCRGRGELLLKAFMSQFCSFNFFAVGWVKRSSHKWDAKTIFFKNGFSLLMHKEGYWFDDSISNGYGCPYCQTGCQCSATIVVKSNNNGFSFDAN